MSEQGWRDAAARSLDAMYERALAAEAEVERLRSSPQLTAEEARVLLDGFGSTSAEVDAVRSKLRLIDDWDAKRTQKAPDDRS